MRSVDIAEATRALAHFPPGEFEDLVPIWLWSKREGVFSHETALVLHGLSDALPGTTSLTLPEAWRRRRVRVPAGVVAHYGVVDAADRSWVGLVPVTTPLRSVVDCARVHTDPRLVAQAARQGVSRGAFAMRDLEAACAAAGLRVGGVLGG